MRLVTINRTRSANIHLVLPAFRVKPTLTPLNRAVRVGSDYFRVFDRPGVDFRPDFLRFNFALEGVHRVSLALVARERPPEVLPPRNADSERLSDFVDAPLRGTLLPG